MSVTVVPRGIALETAFSEVSVVVGSAVRGEGSCGHRVCGGLLELSSKS